ncbi:MAG: FG-GAP-like repeat-containing protein [Sphingomonadales bacterium]|jgi:hypothetical protein
MRYSGNPYACSILILVLLTFFSCGENEEKVQKIFELTNPEETGITFANTIPENDTLNQFNFLLLFSGNGVATGDLNNDGLPEIIFTGNEKPAVLYLNKGDFTFEDITEKSGLKTSHWMGGISMADVNNDGYLDIYICRNGPDKIREHKRNLLFINNGNLTFTEKAAEWGVDDPGNSTCASFFDMDNDGDLDMYLGNNADRYFADVATPYTPALMRDEISQQHLFRNDGEKFTDVSEEAGVSAMGYCLSVTAADFNKDGFVDLYVCNDVHVPDFYYVNNGDGTFTNQIETAFKHTSNNSMGADAADYNKDGWLDLFTADMLSEDPRRFGLLAGPKNYDFFTTALRNGYGHQYMHNNLQTNFKGHFADLAYLNGVARTDWSWSPLFADYDNDGKSDLFITNGYYRDVSNMDFILYQTRKDMQFKKPLHKLTNELGRIPTIKEIAARLNISEKDAEKISSKTTINHKDILEQLPFEKLSNYAYRNMGNYRFTNVTQQWGLEEPTLSTGSTYADLDADGKLDLIICNQGEVAHVYKNIGPDKNYLRVKCKGGKKNNRWGIGCKFILETDSGQQLMEMQPSRGFQSATEPIIHIGLGEESKLKKLTAIWPNGEFQILNNIKCNQVIDVNENNASGKWDYSRKEKYTFEEITTDLGLNFIHREGDNPDFKREPLLPHRFSMQGPGSTTGDVNGDGLTDLLISNARESNGSVLYLQTKDGKLTPSLSQPWKSMNNVDALGCLMFDADADGDNDIYMAAGGSEYIFQSPAYRHRIYFNDGKGNFTERLNALPDMKVSGACVSAGDLDGDGDLDLFVGGRLKPGMYPEPNVRSYLLQNNNGSFTDVTEKMAPALMQPGMVGASVFCDYNNDNKTDLIISGEWMPISVFMNNGKVLVNQSAEAGTEWMYGWYNSLMAVDIDNDADLDLVAGNKGMNSFFQATQEQNIKIFWSDLDRSGNIDFWLTYNKDNKDYPAYDLDIMATAFPMFMLKKFRTYASFAGKSVQEVFGEEHLKNNMSASQFNSILLRNNEGKFTAENLPRLAQAAPLCGITTADVDGNGYLDIIGLGNSYAPRVEHGRDDALAGFILYNNEGTNFTFSHGTENGFYVDGDAKSLVWMDFPGKSLCLVATQNNNSAKVFTLTTQNMKFIAAPRKAARALVNLNDGRTRTENLTNGWGYLSAPRPGVWQNNRVKSVQFLDANGNRL